MVFFHRISNADGVRRTPFVQKRSAMETPFVKGAPSPFHTVAARVFVSRMESALTPFVPICAPMTKFVGGGSSSSWKE